MGVEKLPEPRGNSKLIDLRVDVGRDTTIRAEWNASGSHVIVRFGEHGNALRILFTPHALSRLEGVIAGLPREGNAMTNNTDDSALVRRVGRLAATILELEMRGTEDAGACEVAEIRLREYAALRARESDAAKIEAWLREQAREWSDAGEGLVAAAISGLADAIARVDWRDTPANTELDALVEDETAWLIELGSSEPCRPRYWGGVHEWTEDHMKAIRYCREVDAQSAAESIGEAMFPDSYRLCEHAWMGDRHGPA